MSVSYQDARAEPRRLRRPSLLLTEAIAAGWQRYTVWRSRRLAAAALRRLDDRMLKDIGIDRSEIASVVHNGGSGRTIRTGTR